MINPFDFTGPQFLVFYAALMVASAGPLYLFWRSTGRSGKIARPLTDPYQIAYLRGGASEAVKVAAATLAHRGHLKVTEFTFTSEPGESALNANALERAILEECIAGTALLKLCSGRAADKAEQLYHQHLVSEHLILSDAQKGYSAFVRLLVVGALLGVAVTKILIAIQRGRHNVNFLVMLSFCALFVHARFSFWRTPNGRVALQDLRVLFNRLKSQVRTFAQPTENRQFSFLMGVFGISALSETEYSFLSAFKPRPGTTGDGVSSCGSSCGGGGCGGGCGGCGS